MQANAPTACQKRVPPIVNNPYSAYYAMCPLGDPPQGGDVCDARGPLHTEPRWHSYANCPGQGYANEIKQTGVSPNGSKTVLFRVRLKRPTFCLALQ